MTAPLSGITTSDLNWILVTKFINSIKTNVMLYLWGLIIIALVYGNYKLQKGKIE